MRRSNGLMQKLMIIFLWSSEVGWFWQFLVISPVFWPILFEISPKNSKNIKKSVTNKWEFECDFGYAERGWVCATSTFAHPGGWGNTVCYDIDLGRFSGYGQSNDYE